MPFRGAFVADVAPKDVVEIGQVRERLEGLAAGLAARLITPRAFERVSGLLDALEPVGLRRASVLRPIGSSTPSSPRPAGTSASATSSARSAPRFSGCVTPTQPIRSTPYKPTRSTTPSSLRCWRAIPSRRSPRCAYTRGTRTRPYCRLSASGVAASDVLAD